MRQAVRKSPVIFTIIIAVLLVAWWSIGFIPLASPKLIVYFDQSPPEEVHPEDTFEVSIGVVNEGEGYVRDIYIHLQMPDGFTESVTGTNMREVKGGKLSPHDGFGQSFKITVSNILHGNFTLTLRITTENVPEQVLTSEVEVLPSY